MSEPPWDAEAFRQRLARARGTSTDTPAPATPFHQAAAVLSTFDPDELRAADGSKPTGDALRRLLADAHVVRGPDGVPRWALKPAPRREALESFPDRAALRAALGINARPPGDPVQRYLDGFILGRIALMAPIPDDDLAVAEEVSGWLSGLPRADPLSLPDPGVVRRRAALLQFLHPLVRTTGPNFQGRETELKKVRAFATVAMPFSFEEEVFQTEKSGGAAITALPPLMFYGLGGIGKSTLMAKAALDHLGVGATYDPTADRVRVPPGAAVAAPAVFLDMDRPTLSAEAPATLLLEAARQLDAQVTGPSGVFRFLGADITDYLHSNRVSPDGPLDEGRLLGGRQGGEWLSKFADHVKATFPGATLLLVIDTFEGVQYQSRRVVEQVWQFLSRLRDALPATRAVVSGRTRVDLPVSGEPIELTGLAGPAATALLRKYGVPADEAERVAGASGGNPLTLRLAAELYRRMRAEGEFTTEEFVRRLQEDRRDAYLLRRILDHAHSDEVRKLAHPGLLLRKITPELILKVLAVPCGLTVSTPAEAQQLWQELARETDLVVQDKAGDTLRHRPDLRAEMVALFQSTDEDRAKALAVHRSAVAYYELLNGPGDRAEELYHRLSAGDPREVLDRVWSQFYCHLGSA